MVRIPTQMRLRLDTIFPQVMVMNMNNNNVGRKMKNDDIADIVKILSESEEKTSGNVFYPLSCPNY